MFTPDRLHIPTVQGNHDLNAVRHAQVEPRDRGMSWDTIAWLEALPRTRHYSWAGKLIALAHASLAEGSITKGRCRLGSTCAVLVLPDMTLEVHSTQSGARVELGDRC